MLIVYVGSPLVVLCCWLPQGPLPAMEPLYFKYHDTCTGVYPNTDGQVHVRSLCKILSIDPDTLQISNVAVAWDRESSYSSSLPQQLQQLQQLEPNIGKEEKPIMVNGKPAGELGHCREVVGFLHTWTDRKAY